MYTMLFCGYPADTKALWYRTTNCQGFQLTVVSASFSLS